MKKKAWNERTSLNRYSNESGLDFEVPILQCYPLNFLFGLCMNSCWDLKLLTYFSVLRGQSPACCSERGHVAFHPRCRTNQEAEIFLCWDPAVALAVPFQMPAAAAPPPSAIRAAHGAEGSTSSCTRGSRWGSTWKSGVAPCTATVGRATKDRLLP